MTRRALYAQAYFEVRTLGYIRTFTAAQLEAIGLDVGTLENQIKESL